MGRFEEAVLCFDRAIALDPDQADALVNRGSAFAALNRLHDALASYDTALAVKPDLAAALNNRGALLLKLGRYAEALASLDRALAIKPDYADALANRGNALIDLGRAEEALASYDKALAINPAWAGALNNRGNALKELKRCGEALESFNRALALAPNDPMAFYSRANALLDLKRPAEALASYDRAIALASDHFDAHNNRGVALVELGREDEALASYDKAIALKADFATAYDNKGIALLQLGRVEEARSAFEAAIELAPKVTRSYHHLAMSKRFERDDPRLRAMEELAQENSSLDIDERIYACFALGKALADIEEHERAFSHLCLGNVLKRKQTAYDEARVLGHLERTRATCTSDFLARHYGCGDPSAVPIFVVGMPRSGTSLVEQILASHSDVHGAGEIKDFDLAVADLGAAAGSALHRPEVVSQMSGEEFRRLGTNYLQRIRAAAPLARRIVNKMTENYRFAGLIALALPNARIVHVRRDPVDTCVSCFSTLFVENLPYTYDLAELGRYYRAYEALMNFWRDVLPRGVMIDVQYEDVVADIEGQGRRILDHCGLEWDPRCLDFHRNERAVRTASVAQVRCPLYNSSVGRWRRYETFLEPLLASLGPSFATADRPRSLTDDSPPSALAA
jgi:tetratricopeptide (TPR) repeat protein